MLDALIEKTLRQPVSTVIHVGAGRGASLKCYARFPDAKVLLVEGDLETSAVLRRAARSLPSVRVLANVVAPTAGRLDWYRYNLPALNGPYPADAFAHWYPKLRRINVMSVRSVALAPVIGEEVPARDSEPVGSGVLILDVPGQEAALLESIGDQLFRFQTLIVRRSAAPPNDTGCWEQLKARLREKCFDFSDEDASGDPLWPSAMFYFDSRRYENEALRHQVNRLRRRVVEVEGDYSTVHSCLLDRERKLADCLLRVSALENDVSISAALASERTQVAADLTRMNDEQAKLLAAQIDAEAQARAELAARDEELGTARVAVARLERSMSEQAGRIEALETDRARAQAEADRQAHAVAKLTEREALLQSRIAEQTQAAAGQLEEVSAIQLRLAAAVESEKATSEVLARERARTTAELAARDAELAIARLAYAQIERSMSKQASRLEALETDRARAQAEADRLAEAVAKLSEREALLQSRIAEQSQAAAGQLEEIATLKLRMEDSAHTRDEALARAQRLSDDLVLSQQSMRLVQLAKDAAQQDLGELQRRFAKQVHMLDENQGLLAALKARLGYALERLESLDAASSAPRSLATTRSAASVDRSVTKRTAQGKEPAQ
jgi:chromosome segregation ATPase